MEKKPNILGELANSVEKTSLAEDVRKELREKSNETLVDPIRLRMWQDWSYLARKVVGGEDE